RAFAERRTVIVDALNKLPGVRTIAPGGAFYAFANVTGTGMSSRVLQDLFLETAGVATISGTSFGINGEGFIRFSYANSAENIQEAMQRIGNALL
ncbi:MAG: pyridoxal phosphate-dependent aminotransferase, partial [Pseudomonadota bacterium]